MYDSNVYSLALFHIALPGLLILDSNDVLLLFDSNDIEIIVINEIILTITILTKDFFNEGSRT